MEDSSMFQRPRTVALEDENPGTYGSGWNYDNSDGIRHAVRIYNMVSRETKQKRRYSYRGGFRRLLMEVEQIAADQGSPAMVSSKTAATRVIPSLSLRVPYHHDGKEHSGNEEQNATVVEELDGGL
ncbi:hypothetical protein PIB30_054306 [Stylosanthes scabra]|uniref:Uncharacterized protein n=1 Tax=Stylosanthes scabra TaxID=79078 RepID=A0ABU6ZHJ3_9FABA|nr:hypothetical protein [Stylosanthes scabra]